MERAEAIGKPLAGAVESASASLRPPREWPAQRWLSVALVALCAAAVAYFAWHALRAITFPFPLDYGEGPLLDQARRIDAGENIYSVDRTHYPLTISNYPPLYPTLLALLRTAFGPSFAAARSMTVLSALACAGLVGGIVRATTRDGRAAFIAFSLFLASPYVVFWSTLVRIDFVALAFSLAALALLTHKRDAPMTPVLAALLILAAALTRQSHLLAAPLAGFGALLGTGWRRASFFAATLVLGGGAAFVTLQAATGGGFFFHVVTANANPLSFALLIFFLKDALFTTGPLVAIALVVARAAWFRGRPEARLLTLYLLGTILTLVTIGKIGSHVNYLLELVAAVSIFGGVMFARVAKLEGTSRSRVAVAVVFCGQVAWLAGVAMFRPENMDRKLAIRSEFERLEHVVEVEPQPVIADETMGVVVLSGKPILFQPFELSQLARQGLWDPSRVLADVRAKRFGLILINDGPATPDAWAIERWTPAMLAEIHAAYEPAGALADATLYRPRPSR